MNSSHESTHQPNHKTRAELINWRRNKIIELKSQGHNQEEIAKVLQVSPATVTVDLQYLRHEAMENVQEYTTKQYPLQFKIALVGIQNCMKVLWHIIESSPDNKEKMQAIEHYRQCQMDVMAMLQGGGDALESIIARYQFKPNPKPKYKQGDLVFPNPDLGERFSPHVYHSNNGDR